MLARETRADGRCYFFPLLCHTSGNAANYMRSASRASDDVKLALGKSPIAYVYSTVIIPVILFIDL